MKFELDIDNIHTWWINQIVPYLRVNTLKSPRMLEKFIDGGILRYEEFIHEGNDGIFFSFLIFNFYLMFD